MTDSTTTRDAAGGTGEAPAAGAAASFRWRLAHRPDVRFGHAAGGVAGVLVVAAVVAFVAAVTGDDPRWPGTGFTAGLIVLAVLAGWWVRGPVRSAAVAAIALAVPLLWSFAIAGDGESIERGDFRLILGLSVATYAVSYVVTWTRGRAVLLGLALLFAANWVVFEVANQDVPFAVGVVDEAQSNGFEDPSGTLASDDKTTETAVADLAIAVVLLGAGVVLDRRRRAGAATPCLLVGGFYAVSGALTLGADLDDVYAVGAFLAVAGLAIGLAGSLGRRRGTSWIGAVVLLAGVLTLIAQGTEDSASSGGDSAAWRFGVYALLGAAVLLALGIVVARALAEPVDGGEPDRRPPTPELPLPAAVASGTPTAPAPAAPPPVAWSAPEPPSGEEPPAATDA